MLETLSNLLVQFLDAFRCAVIVHEYERGIVLRFGRFHRTIAPGMHWCWPFYLEHPITTHVVTAVTTLGVQSLTTRDGQAVSVSCVVTWSVKDAKKLLLEVDDSHSALTDACLEVVAKHIARSAFAELSADTTSEAITKEARRRGFKYGIEIDSVQFSDLTKAKSLRLWQAH